MRKNLLTLFALCALLFLPNAVKAEDYTVEPTTAIKSNTVPMFINSASVYGSITQQIFLPSEMKDAGDNTPSAGDITAITFYYAVKDGKTAAAALSRDIEIWLLEIDDDIDAYQYDDVSTSEFSHLYKSKFFCNASKKAGTKVYDGKLNTNAITIGDGKQSVKLNITPFAWDGESNVVLTLYDKSAQSSQIGSDAYDNLRFYITETTDGRFVHWRWTGSATDDRNDWMNDLDRYGDTYSTPTNTEYGQAHSHRYVSLTTFSIVTPIPAPTNLTAGSITTSSATLSWDAATGATGYNVRWGKTSGSLDHSQSNVAATSLAISDLDDGETYYFDVQTITAGGTSAWASEANFKTTAIAHIHDGITFLKWSSANSMPTSGNYYLANNVTYDFYEGGYLDLAGDLNLCLNGNTINLGIKSINVTNGHTMTVFDHVGGGKITGFVAGDDGAITFKGVISVENNATLVLREGEVENTYPADDPEYKSIAIASGGTLIISGEPFISGNDMDIFLPPTIPAKVIMIEPGKPLTNTTPYKVYKESGVITSGWANMSGADPKDYFVSANPGKIVYYNGSEAALKTALNLSESSANTSIGDNYNQTVDVNLTRSTLTNESFNTICLPFALTAAQMEEFFGEDYDLEEFFSSSLEGEVLNLSFNKVTSLEAGKPYLLKPSSDVTNPVFEGVAISAILPVDQTSDTYISFHGTYAPTELTGGNKNLLFLGADNELFWPETTGNIKGFRAYFEVKGAAQKAAKRARIVQAQDAATALEQTETAQPKTEKILRNGQLYLMYNGTMYDVQGKAIKN